MNLGDLFLKHPKQNELVNNGVTRVRDATTAEEMRTLRFELQTFVCEGQYAKGLEIILRNYLAALEKSEQPAAWASGFFGSGKSTLVKVLRNLWVDLKFEDGATARGLVQLPTEIKDQLKELSTAGRKYGGLHAASGTLGAELGDNVRLSLLHIILRSVGLPSNYSLARFVLWLRERQIEEQVRKQVQKAGKDFEKELKNLYVSTVLARCVLDADTSLAASPQDLLKLIKEQFKQRDEITIDEMLEAVRDALGKEGKLPCTLVVLDEVQQFIGDDSERTHQIQEVVEACSKQLNSRMMFVATGQSALTGAPQLQKLKDRFRISIHLSDADVETVIRKIVLAKKPDKTNDIKTLVSAYDGEIHKHLVGTKIGPRSEDDAVYVSDYPLLPVRRRFWEKVLRAVDTAGTVAQLRNQLKIVYEAVKEYADAPPETAVGGDFIYRQIATDLLQTGALQQKIEEIIRTQDNGTKEGRLASRICALVFLINKLPREAGADLGVRATPDTLADLLVEDLKLGSAELRKEIPGILKRLVDDGHLMFVDPEFRIQTPEGAAWDQDYRKAYTKILNDDARIAAERTDQLRAAVADLGKTKILHGISKVPRKPDVFTGQDTPTPTGQGVPVWIRDGWNVDEGTVVTDAKKAGVNSPMIFVYIPKRSPEEIKKTIASLRGAEETLQVRGVPTTDEGQEARSSIETRRNVAHGKLKTLIDEVIRGSRVFMAGGNELPVIELITTIQDAAKDALTRLHPDFDLADNGNWENVIKRVRQGDGNALVCVGYNGDVERHNVSSAVLSFVASGKKGSEIRKHFGGGSYGWPQDAIDGALLLLGLTGHLRITHNTQPMDAKTLDQSKIGVCDFRSENITVTAAQKIALRKLFQSADITCKPNEEQIAAPQFLTKLVSLAQSAGGDAPAPERPGIVKLGDLQALTGNEQLVEIFKVADDLKKNLETWKQTSSRIAARLPRWHVLELLLAHAKHLPEGEDIRKQAEAVRSDRLLLADPDPVEPLAVKIVNLLRDRLTSVYTQLKNQHATGMQILSSFEPWNKIKEDDRATILKQNGISALPQMQVGTEAELLATLEDQPLESWRNLADALPQRFQKAAKDAAKLLEPKVVYISLPSATIRSEQELDAWLATVRSEILANLSKGPVGL